MQYIERHSNEKNKSTIDERKITTQMNILLGNLQNHLDNKVKLSFIPNEYYNDKIYILVDYSVKKDTFGQTLNLLLRDEGNLLNYTIENIVDLKSSEYFNRIEYKATVMSIKNDCYNFCLYY